MAKNHCVFCGKDSGQYRVCESCYSLSIAPCPSCGKPTPQITKQGKPYKNKTCIACTSRNNADKRRTGVKCKVCGIKKPSTDYKYQVCEECQKIKVLCPICKSSMPKYKKRGQLRKFCSNRCNKLSHPTTSEQAIKARGTRRKRHPRKSHQNRIARGSNKYINWRKAVFKRDNYTCQKCGDSNYKGRGKTIELHPHHIKPFATYPSLRYEVDNGITLCAKCHRKKHNHIFIGKTKNINQDYASSHT